MVDPNLDVAYADGPACQVCGAVEEDGVLLTTFPSGLRQTLCACELEGWVIQHPSGLLELDYFHVEQPRRREKDGGELGSAMSWEEWMAAYRSNCVLIRMRLHPAASSGAASNG